jgi:hypothetical protein
MEKKQRFLCFSFFHWICIIKKDDKNEKNQKKMTPKNLRVRYAKILKSLERTKGTKE